MLPALPSHQDWKTGNIKGLNARGGFEVDIQWRDGALQRATVLSQKGSVCRLLLPAGKQITDANGKTIVDKKTTAQEVQFETVSGERYQIL
jgi:alpha-L-fucosidase 2